MRGRDGLSYGKGGELFWRYLWGWTCMDGVSGFNCVTERCPQRRNVVCEATAQ